MDMVAGTEMTKLCMVFDKKSGTFSSVRFIFTSLADLNVQMVKLNQVQEDVAVFDFRGMFGGVLVESELLN